MPASRNVIWSSAARRDLQRIYFHIAQFSPSSADAFTLDLYRKIESLAKLGLTGSQPMVWALSLAFSHIEIDASLSGSPINL